MLVHNCGSSFLDYDEVEGKLFDNGVPVPLISTLSAREWEHYPDKHTCSRCNIDLRTNRFNRMEVDVA